MSILLSDEELQGIELEDTKDDWDDVATCTSCQRIVSRAAVINAVQYMEGKCTEHPIRGLYFNHRFDCPECMSKIHKELENG